MHIKFIKRGTGSAKAAATYLLGECDHTGKTRASIRVLRGNPESVASVAEALSFQHKYTSGVIAWHPNDQPTDAQIDEVINEFESLAYAGIDKESRCWSAVQHHEDDGSTHVHIFAARVDLNTDKSFNIAPPNHHRIYDPLRDYLNHKYAWQSPDPTLAKGNQNLLSSNKRDPNLSSKEVITNAIAEAVVAGSIINRNDVVDLLKDAGIEVAREANKSITILLNKKRVRLKGALYEQDFKSTDKIVRDIGQQTERPRRDDRETIEAAKRDLEQAYSRRAEYNKARYSKSEPTAVDQVCTSRPESLSRHLRSKLGDDAIPSKSNSTTAKRIGETQPRETATNTNDRRYSIKHLRQSVMRTGRRITTEISRWLADLKADRLKRLEADEAHRKELERLKRLQEESQREQEARVAQQIRKPDHEDDLDYGPSM